MASASVNAIAVNGDWLDLVAGTPALANVDVDLQFNGACDSARAEYRLGGAQPAANVSGRVLKDGASVTVNSDHIWVRSTRGGRIDPITL